MTSAGPCNDNVHAVTSEGHGDMTISRALGGRERHAQVDWIPFARGGNAGDQRNQSVGSPS